MVPKYLQTGSTDILASIRQSILRGESNSSPLDSSVHFKGRIELFSIARSQRRADRASACHNDKKGRHCHSCLTHRAVFKVHEPVGSGKNQGSLPLCR